MKSAGIGGKAAEMIIAPASPDEGEVVHKRAEAVQRRRRRFNPVHAGASANPATGMDAAPTNSPTTPEMAASTIHARTPAAGGKACAAASSAALTAEPMAGGP